MDSVTDSDHVACPHCGRPIDEVVAAGIAETYNRPGKDGMGPTLQEIVERLRRKAQSKLV